MREKKYRRLGISSQEYIHTDSQGKITIDVESSTPNKDPVDKGKFQGRCNRSACLVSLKDRDNWYNKGNGYYYCPLCADRINEYSKLCSKVVWEPFKFIEEQL